LVPFGPSDIVADCRYVGVTPLDDEGSACARNPAIPRLARVLVVLTVSCLAAAGAFAAITPAGASGGTAQNGELVADGAWCWFQDPRAIHYVGTHDRTYIGYVTSAGDIDMVSQDAGTAALTHTTLRAGLQADDHAAPGLVVLPDRRIAVFYSKHAAGAMLFRTSVNAEDITAFGPETAVSTNVAGGQGATYGNPIYLSAEHRLYLFFRGANYHPVMTWTTDYVHWSRAVDVAVSDEAPALARPYVKYATNGVDRIAITFTDGHPREVKHNSVYDMVYKAGVLSAPDGTPITVLDRSAVKGTTPVPHTGAMHTNWLRAGKHSGLVYDDHPGGAPAWIESMTLDASGAPVIVFSTYRDPSNAPYYYARRGRTGWSTTYIADAGGTIDPGEPQYSGGADIDRSEPGTVYLSRETPPGSGDWELGRWTIGSRTVAPVTQTSTVKNVRPVVPWGPPGEIQVLWMSGTYTKWYGGGYHTQLREITTNLAPTSARISASATAVTPGATVQIGAAAAQGYRGDPLRDVRVDLLGHTAGQPDQVLQSAHTDATGHATFTVITMVTTAFSVHTSATATFGAAQSSSVVVRARTCGSARHPLGSGVVTQSQSGCPPLAPTPSRYSRTPPSS
jgi:BNR repeat-containing family member